MGRFAMTTILCTALSIMPLLHVVIGQKTALMVKARKSKHPQPIKLNTDSFEDLVLGSDVLIDRSLLIKEVLELPEKQLVVACPPKWSKSVNLNMIKTFVQIETDVNGNPLLPVNRSFVYQMFQHGLAFNNTENESFERPFLISQHRKIIDKHLGQHPVVHIRFKGMGEFDHGDADAIDNIKSVVKQAYEPHRYLINVFQEMYKNTARGDTVKREKLQDYIFYIKRILEETETDETSLMNSLNFLCKMLFRHYGKGVFVLIDDYDVPYYKALHSKHCHEFDYVKNVVRRIEEVVAPILVYNHQSIERVIITATYRITDVLGLSANSDTIRDLTLADNPWLEYFAIDDHEQRQLCEYAGKTERQCRDAFEWYMGYKSADGGASLGQPFSMANFLSHNSSQLYRYQRLEYDYTYELFKMKTLREYFETMMNGDNVTIKLIQDLRFKKREIRRLKQIAFAGLNLKINDYVVDLAFSYLCASGYLTFIKPDHDSTTAQVSIPNKETLTDIYRKLKAWYGKSYGISHNYVKTVVHRLQDYLKYNDTKQASYSNTYMKHLFNNVKTFNPLFAPTSTADEYYEELLYSVLNYISIMWRSYDDAESTVWREQHPTTFYMAGVKKDQGVVIAVRYNQPAERLLQLAAQKQQCLEKYPHLRSHKLVAFSINADRILSMGAE